MCIQMIIYHTFAGFDCDFNALNPGEETHELNQAIRTILKPDQPSKLDIVHSILPVTRIIVNPILYRPNTGSDRDL